jgi:putative membrane protein
MGTLVGVVIGILIGALFSGLVIWVVGKLGWGIEVDGFGPAYLTAIVIAVFNAFATWFWAQIGYEGASIPTHIILTAGFLVAAGSLVKGLRVKGFVGALIAAVVIAAIYWLIGLGVGSLV